MAGRMAPEKLQRTLEQTMDHFERSTLELRRLCETYSPGAGGYQRKAAAPPIHAAGYVEQFGYGWLHIVLSTLLPHCRYQAPAWLSDTLAACSTIMKGPAASCLFPAGYAGDRRAQQYGRAAHLRFR